MLIFGYNYFTIQIKLIFMRRFFFIKKVLLQIFTYVHFALHKNAHMYVCMY